MLRDFTGRRHHNRLLTTFPNGRLPIGVPYRQARFLGDDLWRNQIEVFARTEIRVHMLPSEDREHNVTARAAHSCGRRDNAALDHPLRTLPLRFIHLGTDGNAGHIVAGLD